MMFVTGVVRGRISVEALDKFVRGAIRKCSLDDVR